MKRYTFEFVITEGNSEFWEELLAEGKTGCDELLEQFKDALAEHGFDPEVKLIKYEDK
jgi:predicted ATP-grasp superfamily ATP-dependent carboligase